MKSLNFIVFLLLVEKFNAQITFETGTTIKQIITTRTRNSSGSRIRFPDDPELATTQSTLQPITLTQTTAQQPPTTKKPLPFCMCVTTSNCEIAGGVSPTDGAGKIIPRILESETSTSGTYLKMTTPAALGALILSNQTDCDRRVELCCTPSGYQCGLRYPPVSGSMEVSNPRAPFGAYPPQAIIFSNSTQQFITNAVLIDNFHLITSADRVLILTKNIKDVRVRLGEWDFRNDNEVLPDTEFNVTSILIHPSYEDKTFKNNIAIIRLSNRVALGVLPTIGTACLPSSPISKIRCWHTGWRRGTESSVGAGVMRQVEVPLVNAFTCETQLRKTKLGSNFNLDSEKFICAGGEKGNDTCSSLSGSSLFCEVAGQLYITGIAASEIDCGQKDVPGIFVNIVNYVPWIQASVKAFEQTVAKSKNTTTVKVVKGTIKPQTSPVIKKT